MKQQTEQRHTGTTFTLRGSMASWQQLANGGPKTLRASWPPSFHKADLSHIL